MDVFFYILIGGVVIILIWFISTKNKLNQTIVKIDESLSGIDVALTKRYDVLVKMMDSVKSYVKHEKETLFEVINLRQGLSVKEKINENEKMTKNIEKINLLVENYPELKASETFTVLQQSIIEVEEHLQAARRMYNSNVSIYNQMLVTIPSSIVASMSGMTKKDFFEAEEVKKQDVKIDI